MNTDKIDPSKKDATISSTDDLTKTINKGDVELSEEELKRVTGGSDVKVNVRVPTPNIRVPTVSIH